ncbi:uncharacterized protein BYT42DRAFT_569290 [Radiomyces spectabilis]|uniref:uncharacterized protein n=1 Tax=Radiomyces spectabilis TaxID=64574 RepID=UPI0022200725|nr:uncharacterized protein BYT42DRAFT_569290 [Radiomyces spectabilis]KAI8379579.1 hypothetical protein BYT42DRAFT_569290 [Radiomyces spectabilis]
MFTTRGAAIVLVPVSSLAAYSYIRTTAQPGLAHSHIMTLRGSDHSGLAQWRKINNGLGLVDVSRSGGGL